MALDREFAANTCSSTCSLLLSADCSVAESFFCSLEPLLDEQPVRAKAPTIANAHTAATTTRSCFFMCFPFLPDEIPLFVRNSEQFVVGWYIILTLVC